jgi:uncharacterized protein YaaR (DUF327 family)
MPLLDTFGKRLQAYFVLQSVLEYGSVIKTFIRGVSKFSNFKHFQKSKIKINARKMNHKILNTNKGRGLFGRGPANEYI